MALKHKNVWEYSIEGSKKDLRNYIEGLELGLMLQAIWCIYMSGRKRCRLGWQKRKMEEA